MRPAGVQTENEQVQARPAARTTRRHPTRFAATMAAVMLCCLRVPSRAEPLTWVPSATPPRSHVSLDLELSLRARDALLQDKVLAGQLLGISVRNGVATLWGRASSPNMARRAEECLRNLRGLAAVRNELYIENARASQDAQAPMAADSVRFPDTQRAQTALVHRTDEQAPGVAKEFLWRPARDGRAETLPGSAPHPVDRGRQPAAEFLPGFPASDTLASPGVTPPPVPRTKIEESIPVMPVITIPFTGSRTTNGIAQAVEALRVADDRFRGVRADVRGVTVYLSGTVYRWEHLFELARAVARLPGIRDVVFDEIRAEIDP